jgi:GNAT superfamily N-acetyltransferase
VLAYFAVSAHEIVAADLPRRLARGMPERIPALLLGKLVLARRLHDRGLGGRLLFDAYQRVLADTRAVALYLVVEAIDDEPVRFYEHYGFVHAPVGSPYKWSAKSATSKPTSRFHHEQRLPNRLRAK